MYTPKSKPRFKGFRYFTHMFDNEKKSEMQIGLPTDVKHVAHIGWDGPSVNTPSWMNEFKSSPSSYSAPMALGGSMQIEESDNATNWTSEDSKSAISGPRDLPELPKSSRRPITGSATDSPTREKHDRRRHPRKSSKPKDPSDSSRPARISDHNQGSESPGSDQEIRKKTRRKKSKENSGGAPTKSRLKASNSDPNSEPGSPAVPVCRARKGQRSVEVEGRSENGSSEDFSGNLM